MVQSIMLWRGQTAGDDPSTLVEDGLRALYVIYLFDIIKAIIRNQAFAARIRLKDSESRI